MSAASSALICSDRGLISDCWPVISPRSPDIPAQSPISLSPVRASAACLSASASALHWPDMADCHTRPGPGLTECLRVNTSHQTENAATRGPLNSRLEASLMFPPKFFPSLHSNKKMLSKMNNLKLQHLGYLFTHIFFH